MVRVGLLLIGELLDGELLIARAFANRMPDLASRELVATIANRLRLAPDVLPGIDYSVQMRMRDSWSDRARFAIHILAEPWPADVSALRLPLTLRGAYYLFRPLRLAWKYLLHRDRLPRAA
jgi:hypothetical protein